MPQGDRTHAALPVLFVLQPLAKLHLLKGHADGRLDAAADDVRHLARLLFTAEYLLTAMYGAALLGIEQRITALLGAPRGQPKGFVAAFRGRRRGLETPWCETTLRQCATANTRFFAASA